MSHVQAFRLSALLGLPCALTLLAGSLVAAPARRSTAQSATDDFLAAVTLASADVPRPLLPAQRGAFTADQIATQNNDPTGAAILASAGFQAGLAEAFQNPSPVSLLTGAPLGASTVVAVFSSADGAAAWQAYEVRNAVAVGPQFAATGGSYFSATASSPLTTAGFGEQSAAVEVTGTTQISGIDTTVVVDIAFVQRGPVQYTLVIAGYNGHQADLESLASALDVKVAGAIPLLAAPGP